MDLVSALESVIKDISSGRYSSRIRPDALDQESLLVAQSINRLLDTIEHKIQGDSQEITVSRQESLFCQTHIRTLADSLGMFAEGHTHLPPFSPDSNSTSPVYQNLVSIGSSLQKINDAIISLEHDTALVSGTVTDGKLDTRLDPRKYPGYLQKIAAEVNEVISAVERPLKESMRVVRKYSEYDFAVRFDPSVPVAGDWLVFKTAIDSIGFQINDAFGLINRQIMELSANAEQANASVQEVANSSEQVAKNSDAVSENTEQSDAGVRQVLRAMEDLSVTVGEVSQKAESVSRIAQESTALSREGSEFASKAEGGMGVITRNAGEVDRIISEIQQEMKKINEIVRLITEIASQTNLLALNAAIEAARAGEFGRGFAVVAAEVKALALESRESASKITDMISNLQKKSQVASDAVSATSKAVQEGNIMLSDTLRIFGRLVTSVEDISNNIEQVASMNEEQAAAVEEITSSMHEVSAMLKETAKEAVDSAHATGETSTSANQLRVIVDQVAGIAEQISVSMAKFRI